MRISEPDPSQGISIDEEKGRFWREVYEALRTKHGAPPAGDWWLEIGDFQRVLSQLKSNVVKKDISDQRGPGQEGGRSMEDSIYHENPAEVAKAIANGRFREPPRYPPKDQVIDVLTEERDPAHA
jgi:hypothetical protein